MVYTIVSAKSTIPLLLLSIVVAVLVASISGSGVISTTVTSSSVLPSLSSPSSEVSVTLLVCPGLLAVANTLLFTLEVNAAAELII